MVDIHVFSNDGFQGDVVTWGLGNTGQLGHGETEDDDGMDADRQAPDIVVVSFENWML